MNKIVKILLFSSIISRVEYFQRRTQMEGDKTGCLVNVQGKILIYIFVDCRNIWKVCHFGTPRLKLMQTTHVDDTTSIWTLVK